MRAWLMHIRRPPRLLPACLGGGTAPEARRASEGARPLELLMGALLAVSVAGLRMLPAGWAAEPQEEGAS
ncbi:hypothetical protein AB0F25_39365, partial [Streptomyces wedmorensis]|uniref:hypothetical protein n=1 Tax=Streptomyces wedmorensis TaxID=43759 RepID=UPI00344306BD